MNPASTIQGLMGGVTPAPSAVGAPGASMAWGLLTEFNAAINGGPNARGVMKPLGPAIQKFLGRAARIAKVPAPSPSLAASVATGMVAGKVAEKAVPSIPEAESVPLGVEVEGPDGPDIAPTPEAEDPRNRRLDESPTDPEVGMI